jgi:DHA1 family tetracycline resistance protein-like MFS transporter
VARFGERRTLVAGLIFGALGLLIFGLAPTGTWFWIGVPVLSLMGLYGPSMQAVMTRRVSHSEQGRLQGANTSIMGITGMIGPGLFTLTFAHFIRPHAGLQLSGAPFFLGSLLLAVALATALIVTRPGESR